MNIEQAKRAHTVEFFRALRDGDGSLPESDEALNEANRALVRAVAKHYGDAWLGKINLYGDERHGAVPVMWRWDGSLVYNWSCAFVAPRFDGELARLIRERDDAPLPWTAAGDVARIEAIFARLTEVGGYHLTWT